MFSLQRSMIKDQDKGKWVSVAILLFVNLLNYMDRITVSAILEDVSRHLCHPEQFSVSCSDDKEGLMQTAFTITYLLSAPTFGYLGDSGVFVLTQLMSSSSTS